MKTLLKESEQINTLIGQFCADNENWAELLKEEPYCLKIKEDGPYVIFNYDQIRSDFNNPLVREARGIIFIKDEWTNPVCWAFNKFGNYGESYAPEIDWTTAFVTEKIDGSLIKVWYDRGWHISTNGTINAYKATINNIKVKNFGEYFEDTLLLYYDELATFFNGLSEAFTYMFELVGPYNRIVIPYEKPAIYFLGARNKFTGEEVYCSPGAADILNIRALDQPMIYELTSLKDCIKVTEELTWDQEGFVVTDCHSNRVKIKSPAYVLAHFMRNNNVITRKHLIKVVLQNEVEEFLCYAFEYKKELQYCQKLIHVYHKIGDALVATFRKASVLPRQAYAEIVKTLPTIYQGLMFYNYDKECSAQEFTSKWNENKWDDYLTRLETIIKDFTDVE